MRGNAKNSRLELNQATVDLIKRFEGLRLTAYRDAVGIWTIGYGHTKGVKAGDKISKARAEEMLREDVSEYGEYILQYVNVPLNENQYGALTSWCYNVGPANVKRSTLLKKLNRGNYESVPGQLARWNKAGGRVLAGLSKRRAAEGALWATPVDQNDVPDVPVDCVKVLDVEESSPEAPLNELLKYSRTFKALMAKLSVIGGILYTQFQEIMKNPTMMILVGLSIALIVYIIYLKYHDLKDGVG